MIIFKEVRWRNFLSTGNEFTRIQLNRSKSTLIVGTNGAGKCVCINTPITIKNKKTGEVRSCFIGDLYEEINKTRED
jgi:ABC-type branched-subunit amino acid transport system ATPase component